LERIKKLLQNTNKQWGLHLSLIMVLIAVIFPFLPLTDRWILDLSILVMTYILLGWGLNIVVGLAGLLDLGYVVF
ncbi:MAG: branched-chain amino acid ABC transporter permease, partial [Rhodospirillaceae bacterium]